MKETSSTASVPGYRLVSSRSSSIGDLDRRVAEKVPETGAATIGRNSARRPGLINLGLRLSRTWLIGGAGEAGTPGMMGGHRYNLTLTN